VNAPEGVINYGYDLATGRHKLTCSANSEVAYGYDALGRLQTVIVHKRNGAAISYETTTYAYTAVGSRYTVTLPSGIVTTYLYDNLNRLTISRACTARPTWPVTVTCWMPRAGGRTRWKCCVRRAGRI